MPKILTNETISVKRMVVAEGDHEMEIQIGPTGETKYTCSCKPTTHYGFKIGRLSEQLDTYEEPGSVHGKLLAVAMNSPLSG